MGAVPYAVPGFHQKSGIRTVSSVPLELNCQKAQSSIGGLTWAI